MAAPRSTSLRALRQISNQHSAAPISRRGLHITGVQAAQLAGSADKERLSNHDVLQSRALSIAMRRINSNAFSEYVIHQSIQSISHIPKYLSN